MGCQESSNATDSLGGLTFDKNGKANILLITGNKNKLKEFQAVLGDYCNLTNMDIDLEEI